METLLGSEAVAPFSQRRLRYLSPLWRSANLKSQPPDRIDGVEPKVVDVFVFVTESKPQIDKLNCVRAWFRGDMCMGKLDDGKNAKKPYEKPTVTKLWPEQAKLKRLGHASESHQGAKGLLEMRDSKVKKKSASS